MVRSILAALAMPLMVLTACTTSGPSTSVASSSTPAVSSRTPGSSLVNPTPSEKTYPGTVALGWGYPLRGVRLGASGAVLLSPKRLAFVVVGSSTCPWLPTTLDILSPDTIRMDMSLNYPRHGACTADYGTVTVVVAIDPARVDVHHDLSIQLVYGPGAIDHRIAAGFGYLPSG